GLRAVFANSSNQALGADQVDRGRHQEGLNAHVHQARDGFGRAVGVQSGKNQVAGESGFDGNFSGFKVADFADQNNVGILPQKGAQGRCEVQSNLLLHLHLVDAAQLKFDGIFGRHNVGVGLVEARDGGIERVGLTRTCRTGDQHHAVGFENGFLELDQRFGLETELSHVEPQIFLVEQPEHDFLAPQRGQGADTEVELLLAAADIHFQHDAAVLRQPLFADVQLRHDLEAGSDCVFELDRRRHDRLQHAVNTEAHAELFFVRLDVNVAGPSLDRVGEDQIHQLDDRSLVGGFLELRELHLLLFRLQFDVTLVHLLHRLHYGFEVLFFFFRTTVRFLDARENGTFGSHHRLDVEASHELDIVHREDVGRIDHGDGERCTHTTQRKNLIALRGFKGNQLDDGRIDFKVRQVDGGDAILTREKVRNVLVREEAELHQGRAQAAILLLLGLSRLFQLLWGNDLLFDEKVTQPLRHTSISYPPSGTMPGNITGICTKRRLC